MTGPGRGPPGLLGAGRGCCHERVSQVTATLDAAATLCLPVDLCHVVQVNEVAQAQRCQVHPGLLALAGRLDGYAHLRVVRRPAAGVVLPLPQPALSWSRSGLVKAAAHWSEGA